MQDYSNLFPKRYKNMDNDDRIKEIREIIKLNLRPMVMLAMILMIVTARNRS
jgi:hypothetical protein